ncbi:DUF192 domain-containing protein [Candidatus Uhrbacteria bacterium]|nr:DUF192 domain-containing protein [Candidatus Uhrbacteria bacterium]
MKYFGIGFFFLLCIFAGSIKIYQALANRTSVIEAKAAKLQLGKLEVQLEIAQNEEQWKRGLSNRAQLEKNQGMLFIFPKTGIYDFWMKGTRFPLDILWVNQGEVVDMVTLPAEVIGQEPARYSPLVVADRVVEISAGLAKQQGIGIGSKIPILLYK